MCLEGPVGGGKSAFLNAINGNLIRTGGSVHVEDVDAGKLKIKKLVTNQSVNFYELSILKVSVMWHKVHGFNTAQFVRISFGASASMRIATKKCCGRVRCIMIWKRLAAIYLTSVKVAAHCRADKEHELHWPEQFIKIKKVSGLDVILTSNDN